MLRNKVKLFLDTSEMSKVKFCRHVGIAETTLYFLLTGQRDLGAKAEQRIIAFMQDYVKKLVEISAT